MMRIVGKDAPLKLKRKLEVGLRVWILTILGIQLPVSVILTSSGIVIAFSWLLIDQRFYLCHHSSQSAQCVIAECIDIVLFSS